MKRAENRISPQAAAIIAEGITNKQTAHKIQRRIRKHLDEKVTLREILRSSDEYRQKIDTKKVFKKKGADIVRKFLKGIKKGTDVSDLQTVLEQAVYFDCLRRYADEEDTFLQKINPKDLLKITSDYQKLRLQRLGEKSNGKKQSFSADTALKILDVIEKSLSNKPELQKDFAQSKPELIEKIKPLFNRDELEAAKEDYKTMQRIRERYELSKLVGSKRTNGRATA
ncbi:MAG: hypothetical protein IEMM0002_0924 [bacterium]|nr:MAG: hypothetical protein IEMM0002_0924 [bacterium]